MKKPGGTPPGFTLETFISEVLTSLPTGSGGIYLAFEDLKTEIDADLLFRARADTGPSLSGPMCCVTVRGFMPDRANFRSTETKMGWSMFIEEPGDHQSKLPYGVLAGIAVEDRLVWQLARKLRDAESQFFGLRLDQLRPHFTTETILSADVVQHSASSPPMSASDRAVLIGEYFGKGALRTSLTHLSALAQARHMFCRFALELLIGYEAKAFAIFIPIDQIGCTCEHQLRRDYAFLFERFSYFLRDQPSDGTGKLILDASRHTGTYVPIRAITDYFEKTTKGRRRAYNLIPEPLLANSSLAAINQAAAILSYITSSAFRLPGMSVQRRLDLDGFVKLCNRMRISFPSDTGSRDWSFKFVENVRATREAAD